MNAWTRWLIVLWVGLLVTGCAARQMAAPEAPDVSLAPAPTALAESGALAAEPSARQETHADAPSLADAQPAAKPSPAAPAAAQSKTGSSKDEPVTAGGGRPLLIYEADVSLRVEHGTAAETIERIIDIAESNGGYLVSRNDQNVQVRVPSETLRPTMASVEERGEVLRRSVSAQDVSEQYHDLEVRLRSLEAVRDRLQQFLSRATNVTEAMTIAKQLDAVGQQIDQVKGRMKFLRTRAAFSLLSVAITEKPEAVVVEPAPPPAPPAPQAARLPVPWLHDVGLETLTRLPKADD